jgi:acyl-CoA thioester hydrolase
MDKRITHTSSLRVLYADTDQMGIVHNSRYLVYFETARTEMLRDLGLPYAELERQNALLPLLESNVKYLSPARYDDILSMETSFVPIQGVRLQLDYRIHCQDKLLAEGFTKHVFATRDTLRPIRPPKVFMEVVERELAKIS